MDPQFKDATFLARQLRSGNPKAYDFLMDSLYEKLCSYAYTLTKDHGNAEDIVQNVFVDVWTNRMNINPDYSITNYLYRSVYNGFIDQYRKTRPVIFLEKKYLEAIDIVVQNEHENLDELIKLVHVEIEKLPSKCKEIFLLNKKEGLTHTEISEYLNISLKTVEGHMTRAFKILGEKLGKKMKPDQSQKLCVDFKIEYDLCRKTICIGTIYRPIKAHTSRTIDNPLRPGLPYDGGRYAPSMF